MPTGYDDNDYDDKDAETLKRALRRPVTKVWDEIIVGNLKSGCSTLPKDAKNVWPPKD